MNQRAVLRVLGFIWVAVGAAILGPAVVALVMGDGDFLALLLSAFIPVCLGIPLLLGTRGEVDLKPRDGFAVVTFGWLTAALFGAVPYLLTGTVTTPVDAFFESMSGFTTTGSTILADVEVVPHGLLLWRSTTQWLGGMGIVVLSIAILPLLGVGGMQLFNAEVPGPVKDRLAPRIQSVAKNLWSVYLALTVFEVVLLVIGGMGLFDAVCHSFCTVSTGGFSTRNASVGAFQSAYVEMVVVVFMFLSGVNFALHMGFLRGVWKAYAGNEEVRFYVITLGVSVLILAVGLVALNGFGIPDAVRLALFQAVSILTTTGFGTGDYLAWGFGAQLILFLLMFLGACAGSTAGGMKLIRIVVMGKHARAMTEKEIHPRAIFRVRFSGTVVSEDVLMRVLGFFLLYMAIFFGVALVVAMTGVDPLTSIGASIATLSNIGPGLADVGPASTYASLPWTAKILLSFNMLLGRLELYTVLVLLTPMFWRRT